MTNKEYIEKYNLSFPEVIKMWDNQTNHIEDWLNQEYLVCPFRKGDVLKRYNITDYIYVVIDIKDKIYMRKINKSGMFERFSQYYTNDNKFYRDDNTVCYDEFKNMREYIKIF